MRALRPLGLDRLGEVLADRVVGRPDAQLLPYLEAATEAYEADGLPIMRHHLLSDPADAAAGERDDQYLFGPDLLAAPVVEQGATAREVYLSGTSDWVELADTWAFDEAEGGVDLAAAPALREGGQALDVDAPLAGRPGSAWCCTSSGTSSVWGTSTIPPTRCTRARARRRPTAREPCAVWPRSAADRASSADAEALRGQSTGEHRDSSLVGGLFFDRSLGAREQGLQR